MINSDNEFEHNVCCSSCNKNYKSMCTVDVIELTVDENHNTKENKKLDWSDSCPYCGWTDNFIFDFDNEMIVKWFKKFDYDICFIGSNNFELYKDDIRLIDDESNKIFNKVWLEICKNVIIKIK